MTVLKFFLYTLLGAVLEIIESYNRSEFRYCLLLIQIQAKDICLFRSRDELINLKIAMKRKARVTSSGADYVLQMTFLKSNTNIEFTAIKHMEYDIERNGSSGKISP